MKLKIGIIFGGRSKEREISFAGGRTVYDNLNKSLFDAVPIFVDSFNNFVLLDWQYIYKGSIRDFYPAAQDIPASPNDFQIYAESLGAFEKSHQQSLLQTIGKIIPAEELKKQIDLAFLCLHGPFGEDGRIQGLFEHLDIPYTGSGILASGIGINKIVQKKLMKLHGFPSPDFFTISRQQWIAKQNVNEIEQQIAQHIHYPCVVKSPTQGSSIGVSVIKEANSETLKQAIDRSFFIKRIKQQDWEKLSAPQKVEWVRNCCDIREGIGIPLRIHHVVYYHPDAVLERVTQHFAHPHALELCLESLDAESEILIEGFIEGKEFSSIVIEGLNGEPICLPPTEIRKGKEIFDYRSKYLPGLSRKITPIQLPDQQIEAIREACKNLYSALDFGVYARIDGFINDAGTVFLNDPNTTSGMMPSSFFFHQAALER